MSKLDEFFKFKVGQTLKVKNPTKKGLFVVHVVERMTQECPGGIQLHYTGRVLSEESMQNQYIRFNEIELEEYDPKVEAEKETEIQFLNYKERAKLRLRAEKAAKKEIEEDDKE
ncbi:MAG: hypothetical protein V3V74_07100 [Nitrosomonadaceae bacterium]